MLGFDIMKRFPKDVTDEEKSKTLEIDENVEKEENEDMEEKNRNIQEVTRFLKQLRKH